MQRRKIVVAATLREFKNDIHREAQVAFINSIKNQTYQNYLLIITCFFEKELDRELKELNVKYKIIQSKILPELYFSKSKFSLWEVVNNAFPFIERDNTIIVSTLSDIIFENNFFENLVINYSKGFSGTSWPQINYKNYKDYLYKKKYNISLAKNIKSELEDSLYKTISDVYFFDANLMLDNKNKFIWNKAKMHGIFDGIVQIYLFCFYNNNRINIYFKSKIHNITNYENLKPKKVIYSNQYLKLKEKNEELADELCKNLRIKKIYYNRVSSFKKLFLYSSFQIKGKFFQILLLKFIILKNFIQILLIVTFKKFLK
jgi:hypothetical protein